MSQNKIKMVVPEKNSRHVEDFLNNLEKQQPSKLIWITNVKLLSTISIIFLSYLMKKYRSKLVIINNEDKTSKNIRYHIFNIKENETDKDKLHTYKILKKAASRVVYYIEKKEQIIVIPFTIKIENKSHANMLIYRRKYNSIEHFEPYGESFMENKSGHEKVVKILNNFIEIINKYIKKEENKVKLIESDKVCPYVAGFQKLEESSLILPKRTEGGGYCGLWTLFFTELCLKNASIPSSKLLENVYNILMKQSDKDNADYLKNIIRGYLGVVYEKIEKISKTFFKRSFSLDELSKWSENEEDAYRIEIFMKVIIILSEIEENMENPEYNFNEELDKIQKQIKEIVGNRPKIYRKQKEKESPKFKELVYKKKIMLNYPQYEKIITPILEMDENNKNELLENPPKTLEDINKYLTELIEKKTEQRKERKTLKQREKEKNNNTRKNI